MSDSAHTILRRWPRFAAPRLGPEESARYYVRDALARAFGMRPCCLRARYRAVTFRLLVPGARSTFGTLTFHLSRN